MTDNHEPNNETGHTADFATGAFTITGALSEAEAAGYPGTASVREGGQIECKSCGSMFAAGRFGVEREQRLEGASDAADMLIVVAGLCPRCGTGSTMMLGYGPNSSIEDADVLDELEFENARPLVEPAKRN